MTKQEPQHGDVFTIPTGDSRVGIGQVVGAFGSAEFFFAIFERPLPETTDLPPESIGEALSSGVLLFALSLDAKLYHRHWTIIGNAAVNAGIVFPDYKILVDDGNGPQWKVEDGLGRSLRPASEEDVERLSFRTTVAPVRLERAYRASLGLEAWLDYYDELRYKAS